MTDKEWTPIFLWTLVPVIAMIILAVVGNPIIPLIGLGVSLLAFIIARVVEMKGVDLGIIWLCGIVCVIAYFV